MTTLTEKLASLTPEQRALLERKLKAAKTPRAGTEYPAIVHRDVAGLRPLSLDQERLWFIDRIAPGNAAYNVNTGSWLRGSLDVDALQKSINAVVKRHESLRTTFVEQNGRPYQRVAETLELTLEKIDLLHLPESEREAEAERQAALFAAQSFDLTRGPLLRYLLMRLDPARHILVSVMHHIITDWWSSQIVFDEITLFYNAFSAGRAPALPDVPFQFTDFVLWERDYIRSPALEKSRAYWREHLSGGTFTLDLPFAGPRPEAPRYIGKRQWLAFSPGLIRGLRQLSSRENTTLFTVLTAAYKTLLFRYTHQTDITMGGPLADRTRKEWENIVGFMITMLVYHTPLDGEMPFTALLQRVRQVILDAYAHKDVPFGDLMQLAGVERNWNRNALFQHSFIFLNVDQWRNGKSIAFENLEVEHIDYDPHISRFDTTLTIWDMGETFRAYIEYDSDLYSEADMARFGAHYLALLQAIVEQPETPIGRLPMLTKAEYAEIVVARNRTETAYPRSESIIRLFEEQARCTPEAIAISDFDRTAGTQEQTTYRALNVEANQLAHYVIQTRGYAPGAPVAVCIHQSAETVVAILAILKTGGAYVPINPDDPPERIAFILDDVRARTLLTTSDLSHKFPVFEGRVICLDTESAAIRRAPAENPNFPGSAEDAAYVLYTSGSSGRPKGVAVPNRAVIRLVRDTHYIHLTPSDKVGQVSRFSFDASTFEIWGALLNGGTLAPIAPEILLSPQALADCIRAQGITVLLQTTALLNQVARVNPGAFAPLRVLLFGGEAVHPEWVREILKHGPPGRLLHVYGPTESTTFATCREVREVPPDAATVPIGSAISNTTLYVLNDQGQPVPDGVAGELHIGGDGLALGYLNRPELTAEKFIPNPFSDDPKARLYRSGDWVRSRADGSIEFIGRKDNQVKIRGFRIEPDEINLAVGRYPAVADSIVDVREDHALGRYLAAYIVGREGQAPDIEGLKSFLEERLPDYMIPAFFILLESFPLNRNGKVDRNKLPVPTAPLGEEIDADCVAPATPAEKALAGIWSEVLGRDSVGIHDDFFALGGHSLLAIRLVAEIEDRFKHRLPLTTLFRHSTIARLAPILEQVADSPDGTRGEPACPALVPIHSDGDAPPFVCVPGAGGNPYYLWELARALGSCQPFYGLQPPGAEGDAPPLSDMDALVDFFRAGLESSGLAAPYFLGGHSSGAHIAFALALALEQGNKSVPFVVLMDADAPGHIDQYHFDDAEKDYSDFETLGALVPHVKSVKQRLGDKLPISLEHLQTLAGEEALRYVTEAYQASKLLPSRAGLDQIKRMAAISGCTLRAIRDFTPKTRYQGQALLLHARDGDSSGAERMAAGWQPFCAKPVMVRTVGGNHLTMLTEPHVRELAASLSEVMGSSLVPDAGPLA